MLLHLRISYNFALKKSSKRWMSEHLNDRYVKEAKNVSFEFFVEFQLNYRSRAAFKLLELQEKYKILKKGFNVIDIGSSPGGWTQVAVKSVGCNTMKPRVLSIDLLNMPPVFQGEFI